MTKDNLSELSDFMNAWTSESACKKYYEEIISNLSRRDSVELEFNARPGITYSLRAKHPSQDKRPMFVMADIIDDDPENRWISVCFYADLVSDPDDKGEYAPEGLFGEDACCFDLDEDEGDLEYLLARIEEAWGKVSV